MEDVEYHCKIVKVKETYEQIASSYNRVRSKPLKECVNFIQMFDPNSRVLDIGCGTGRHTLVSAEKGNETIGVDFSKNMLGITLRKLKSDISRNFHLVLAEASQLPFKDCSFDYVLYIATLHNLPNRSIRLKSLKEVKRVLKPRGLCLVSVWKRLQFRFLANIIGTYFRKILGLKGEFEVYVPWNIKGSLVFRYFYLYSAGQLRKDIKEAGMEIANFSKVKIGTRIISDNYFVIIRKPEKEKSKV